MDEAMDCASKGEETKNKLNGSNIKSVGDKVMDEPSASNGKPVNGKDAGKDKKKDKDRFRYGNFNQYYGARLESKFQRDPRLKFFNDEWFRDKSILDVGCNIGLVTILIAKEFGPRRILGMDIDSSLVGIARKNIRHYCDEEQKLAGKLIGPPKKGETDVPKTFPDNVWFIQGNYVLDTDEMLEMVVPEYNVVLALSITKWIHLNWGDSGIKRFFKRIYLHLQPGGRFILESQAYETYKKRAKNEEMRKNFNEIKLRPDDFNDFLLNTIGFREAVELGVPEGTSKAIKHILYNESGQQRRRNRFNADGYEQRIQHLAQELNKTKEVLAWHRIELRAAENKIDELEANSREETVKSTSRKRKHSSSDSNIEKDLLVKHLQDSLVEKIKCLTKLKKIVKTDLTNHSTVAKQLRDLYLKISEENNEVKKTLEQKDNDPVKLTSTNNELVDKLNDFEQLRSELDAAKAENTSLTDNELAASLSTINELKTQHEDLKRKLRELEEAAQIPTTSAASQLTESNQAMTDDKLYRVYRLQGQLEAEKIKRQTLESRLSDEEKGDAQAEVVNGFETAIESLFVRASQARSRGNNLEAIQLLQEAIGIELGGFNDLVNLSKLSSAVANSFDTLKQYDAAIEWCTKAVEYMPKDFNFLLQRARLYQQKRDFKNAVNDLSECLKLNPGSKKAKSLLEKIKKEAASR
ncbi:RNA methyltransferase [Aphelenchoides bicaudatus]|nr:RNA methyltransferase [Aphelenchoides bicaudatus]